MIYNQSKIKLSIRVKVNYFENKKVESLFIGKKVSSLVH